MLIESQVSMGNRQILINELIKMNYKQLMKTKVGQFTYG